MQYDRDERYGHYERLGGPEEPRGSDYGRQYARRPRSRVFHGYAMGYAGGALRSRGSYEAGQLRSGLNPRDEFEFEWGDGYVGGRGYGGTNYDYEHGYRVGTRRLPRPQGEAEREAGPAVRGYGAADWRRRAYGEPYGPARYGYGPYHERLRRRRRSDDEIREDVEDTLFYDTWVDADRITVVVEDGVVTLRGTLPSYDEVRYAVDDAWDVDGVRGVRSELQVGSAPRERGARERAAGERGAEAAAGGKPEAAAAAGAPAARGAKRAAEEESTPQRTRGRGATRRSARGRDTRTGKAES